MATNTAALKTFAQETRKKLISLITTKMQYILTADTAELRAFTSQIAELRKQIHDKTEKIVVEEVAYTWFNRVMALRFMDANGYNAPMVVTPAAGQTRPEILQDAMSGSIDEGLLLTDEEKVLPEAKLYRKLLVAVCNKQMSQPMPFLFEHLSTYTELLLPDDLISDQSFVTDIRRGMTDEDCQNVELMGWLYQFYITDRKADAETKKSKKGGLKSDEQAAATQLFTPHWIVRYMVENSLGRIWMTLHPESHLIDSMPYYIPTPKGQIDSIPEDIHFAKDIRFLDPCMGSGHILVYAFDLFTKMYEEEGEQAKDIPTLILQNNIYGIDIDRRCYQLASFALTMKSRAYYRRYLRNTINPHVIALEKIEHDIIESSGNWNEESPIWQFSNIDTIGSLLNVTPEECAAIKVGTGLFSKHQIQLKTQSEYLSKNYHCVVTNPPYLGKGFCDELKKYVQDRYPNSKSDLMATFMERSMEFLSINGYMAMINMHSWMFISSFDNLRKNFLGNFQIESLLHLGPHTFDELSGEVVQNAAFVVRKVYDFSKTDILKTEADNIKSQSEEQKDIKTNHFYGTYFSLVNGKNCSEKEFLFLNYKVNHRICYPNVDQSNFEKITGNPISFWVSDTMVSHFANDNQISKVADLRSGISTGDNNRFYRQWYECSNDKISPNSTYTPFNSTYKWFKIIRGGNFRRWYGCCDNVLNLENSCSAIKNSGLNHRLRTPDYYIKTGITWNRIAGGKVGFRIKTNDFNFGENSPCMFLYNEDNYFTLLAILNSKCIGSIMYSLNPTISNQLADLIKVPIPEIADKTVINTIVQQNIELSQLDWDAHETSWDFKTNELLRLVTGSKSDQVDINASSVSKSTLSLESLVSKYKSFWEEKFLQLHKNEEVLNNKFIEIYGLQDELTSEVPLEDVTILQKGEKSIVENKIVWHDDVIIKQFISYLIGCFMGRFSVNKPGLIIASQGQKLESLDIINHTLEIDSDGIIPIIQEEDFFADDLTLRIENAVKTLFGEKFFYENLKYIKSTLGIKLRDYLFKNYYADHLQMYSVKRIKRPIYWLFSSQMGDKKKKGYFKALVYMHRIENDTLSKLHADYVSPYIQKIEQQLREAEDNATRDDLSQAQHNKALKLVEELKEKVREVKAFETRLVEMASARITIDLDDGVKANYPKFYPLVEPIKGLDTKDED